LAYMTKSVVAKFAEVDVRIKIDDLDWLAMMVSDPESLIVNKNSSLRTLAQIVADAKAKNGAQLWVGPAAGGNDHIMARKTWRALGIQAKWVPFESGEEAMVALMGGHGSVYVGNPEDVTGRLDLENVVISAPKRLGGAWAHIPTFKELGVSGLDEEIMWRGFAIKKGIPEEALKFYHDLIAKVTNDPTWRKYIEEAGADPVFYKDDKFKEIVKEDIKDFADILKELGAAKPK
jgi:putative tricarboxylic transport membrane protein